MNFEAAAMTSKEAAVAVWRALGSGDADRIRSVLADDVEWRAPPENATAVALGVTHHMVGAEAIVRFILDDYPRLFPNGMEIEPISVTAEGDRVIFEQRHSATLANGRAYALDYVFIFEMAGSRVRRIREYMDARSGYHQIFGTATPGRIA
ncbi:nuclear transport factor 2 family protein [Sphingopyxis sp. 2PD]|uniref:nuclear transport factor 2 family protein n=1 Tax=Sphingopyxis sp. 2PD TaxID=2502196 RepID=UPI0014850D9C|nr:nuclear transport factor 2 family protein [Sphingopyxis sp. 2PD]